MKKLKALSLILSFCVVLIGCNNTQKGAGIGAGGGALLGAAIGAIAGNAGLGTAIGATVGTGAGLLIGSRMDKVKKQAEQVKNAQVEEVTDANGLQAVKVTFDSGLLFTSGKAVLSSASMTSLQQFAGVLKDNATCDVEIQGYTDNQGWKNSSREESIQKNIALSQQRADAVSAYLKSLGVNPSQIKSSVGFGENSPVGDNSTSAGQQQNRRVEIYMYASKQMIEAANNGSLK